MTKLNRLMMCLILVGLTSAWALAQDSDENTKSKGEVRNITGCLTKSGSGSEYLLTGSDGSTWEIHENNAVNLADHVNQTVEARGFVANQKAHNMKEHAKDMGHDTGMKNNTAEHGHLKVTSVHKVSDSCQ
jgi:hypothetical protein